MSDPDNTSLQESLQRQRRLVQGLRRTVYSETDPSTNPRLDELVQAEAELDRREKECLAPAPIPGQDPSPPARYGRLLGPLTTNLRVETTVHMQPLPTGFYHLLNPVTDPLFTVTVKNESQEARRVRVTAILEGLSARAVQTREIARGGEASFTLSPTLLPQRARRVTEVQWATLHVKVDILGERKEDRPPTDTVCECHNTYPIVCLARTSSVNAVRSDTGQWVDLTRYYGAWVTPYAEAVQERIRRAASLSDSGMIWGYQGDPASVEHQVKALFQALREAGITYVNSVTDYGNTVGQATQRTRLPRESLMLKSANCIDGTVLMASMLEGASLHPALVFVPGHAFVGWEKWDGSDQWQFLETTMLGQADATFEAACASGQQQHDKRAQFNSPMTIHPLAHLRTQNIWPME